MSFKGLNLSDKMIASLNKSGYISPSDIQLKAIPKALKGETVLVQSETGSGKTLCYVIPSLENIDIDNNYIQVVVISPTRELATQIYNVYSSIIKNYKEIKVKLLKSGQELASNLKALSNNPHIVIATPNILNDVINEKKISLKHIHSLVLDEADMLLKEGYFDDIEKFNSYLNKPQYLIYSATLKDDSIALLEKFVHSKLIILNKENMTNRNVEHFLVDIKSLNIFEATKKFIDIKNPYLLIIFASKKETANALFSYLYSKKYKVGLLTGDLSARERKNVMKRLENDEIYILVSSDIASRGLDIKDVSDVLSVDLPNNLEFYFHRAGRTARFDKSGNSYIFYNYDSKKKPLELISSGLEFNYLILDDDELKVGKPLNKSHPKRRKIDEELEKEIKIIKAKNSKNKNKVKPSYKKKVKEEIDKTKRHRRRELIKKEIRKQRVERYKKEARNG